MPETDHGSYVVVDEQRAGAIADAYEALPVDDSANPKVRASYEALAKEIEAQYRFATAKGVQFIPWTKEGQPYASSVEMAEDIRANQRLYFFTGGNPHPFLDTLDPVTQLTLNDKFRAIHDYFGHAAGGYGFGARGEENAWRVHSQMFSAKARPAMTTETRGQNSWVNFGPHNYDADGNYKHIPPGDRPFATQKVALLPEFYWSLLHKREYTYGTTQVEIDPQSSAAATINVARERIVDGDCMGKGKDISNHVTLRYGLLDDDVDALRDYIASLSPFEVQVLDLHTFEASEASDGAVPLVVRVSSPDLRAIEAEIGSYADFKTRTWPEYVPHITLAYLKPEAVDQYRDLYVDGSFIVHGITIVHRSGVKETIPFGSRRVRKADASGRYVTPFVSFDQQGDAQLQLIASLNASRLATWGFTAEAHVRGIKRYQLTAIIDGRTSDFCRNVAHGKIFEVADARTKVIEVLNVQNPNDLRVVQPWPKQTKAALKEFEAMTPEQLRDRGLHIPPYHPHCRTLCDLVDEVTETVQIEETEEPTGIQSQTITLDTLKELGIDATQEQVDHWNTYVKVSPVQALSSLSGKTPQQVLDGWMGHRAVQFKANGDVALNAYGVMGNVKYSVGTVIDPYGKVYYLSNAELIAGTPGAEKEFIKQLFKGMMDIGQEVGMELLSVDISGGNAITYVQMGFLPSPDDWNDIRSYGLNLIDNGPLAKRFGQLDMAQKMLIQHLLLDKDPLSLAALVDLDIKVQGKSIGEWVLEGATGQFTLSMTDVQAVQQIKDYIG